MFAEEGGEKSAYTVVPASRESNEKGPLREVEASGLVLSIC